MLVVESLPPDRLVEAPEWAVLWPPAMAGAGNAATGVAGGCAWTGAVPAVTVGWAVITTAVEAKAAALSPTFRFTPKFTPVILKPPRLTRIVLGLGVVCWRNEGNTKTML